MPVVYFGAPHLTRLLDGWADQPGSMSGRLADTLRRLVRTGRLPAGARLPSERILASALGVSRNTVGQAFDRLRVDGVLVSRTGIGTFVSARSTHGHARGDDRMLAFVSDRHAAQIDLTSAALPGLPLVGEELGRLAATDLTELLPSHGYLPRGLPVLRVAIADYYTDLGLPTETDQILVTSGAQQAMRLVADALIEPGDTVVVEEPTFRGGIEVLRRAGAQLVGIPSGQHGADLQALAAAIREFRPAFVLLQSTVHNPTGSMLSSDCRAAAARLSADTGTTIVDDAAQTDALIDGPAPVPLAAHGGRILTLGSASKGFWGGLRVGWLRADRSMIDRIAVVKGAEDLGTSIPSQLVTVRLLMRAEEARAHRQADLRPARTLALDLLANLLPEWRPLIPAGGASLWIELPSGFSATALAERARREGVGVLAGPTFSCRDALDRWLRIAYTAPEDTLTVGLHRLADLWHRYPTPTADKKRQAKPAHSPPTFT